MDITKGIELKRGWDQERITSHKKCNFFIYISTSHYAPKTNQLLIFEKQKSHCTFSLNELLHSTINSTVSFSNIEKLSLLLKDAVGEFVLSVAFFESKEEYQLENVFGAA